MTGRLDWGRIIPRAAQIARSYDTAVTLRQLFYRLVAAGVIPNSQGAYKRLSELTAAERRDRNFPALLDQGRTIWEPPSWEDADDILRGCVRQFRVDRTIGQEMTVVLGVEKATMTAQLQAWFGERGLPIVALRGYSSETLERQVVNYVQQYDRGAVLLYAGDHDPSGEDIDRNFVEQTGCWDVVERVALSSDQVVTYDLPVNPGKVSDSRAGAFVARHGELVQVELEALDPDDLQQLYTQAVDRYWDATSYADQLEQEEGQRDRLRQALDAIQ
jgi:hypothetical protein